MKAASENRRFWIMTLALVFALLSDQVHAAGKKPPKETGIAQNGKRVVGIEPLNNVEIELPNQNFRDFGLDFISKLKTKMMGSGSFIPTDAPASTLPSSAAHPLPPEVSAVTAGSGGTANGIRQPDTGGIIWNGSFIPAAKIRFEVDAFSFVTGDRGSRMFYGFDEKFRTPFNSGEVHGTSLNEFPIRKVSFEANWFDRSFDPRGDLAFGSHAGLDLSSGFRLDAVLATLSFKRAHYESRLKLRMFLDSPFSQRFETHEIEVKGAGFFFDLAAAYQGFGGAIQMARTDAMLQALLGVVDGAMQALTNVLSGLRLSAKLDGAVENGVFLLGTGENAGVSAGVVFAPISRPEIEFTVKESVQSGALATCTQGNCKSVAFGTILVEKTSQDQADQKSRAPAGQKTSGLLSGSGGGMGETSAAASKASVAEFKERVSLPDVTFKKPKLKGVPIPEDSFWKGLWNDVKDIVALPYRIWRYFQYDRPYRIHSDDYEEDFAISEEATDDDAAPAASASEEWLKEFRQSPFSHQIGLDRVQVEPVTFAREEDRPLVAVIDTGVDYNHPALHPFLWLNPDSSQSDRYGWDFISGDSRPYDDGSRGTALASAVVGVAPFIRILPVKAFNPWGVTSSAALYASIEYAITKGAKIILCGWATRKDSAALKNAVKLIDESQAILVAASGDRGDFLGEVPAYPAALSASHPKVVTVGSVGANDRLSEKSGFHSNFGEDFVQIAAPGIEIPLAGPRSRSRKYTTSGVSAALVAGALARLQALNPEASPGDLLTRLSSDAEQIPALQGKVSQGLRLRILR